MKSVGVMINAVATLQSNISIESNAHDDRHRLHIDIDLTNPQGEGHLSSSENSTELDDRETLRRLRISKANTPWNKGRKHTPETLRRIREKTRLAMQDPKVMVKMKLLNLGHAQSKETRIKIGVGVRIGWNKRREKLMLQETCHFDWQNLIAEASRRGLVAEEELQWDSCRILDEQLEREWLESVEQRRRTPRPKGCKRAPKSAEQKKKYPRETLLNGLILKYFLAHRDRVSNLSKYHGTPIGADNPRRRQKRTGTGKKNNVTDNSAGNTAKSATKRTRLKRSKLPMYKDPLATSKLEMIKNIRADRENKKAEAITRAKLLIAEAEKAAKALELAASKSPLAQASLIETRKLIAEAIQSIESIEGESDENDPNTTSTQNVTNVEKETGMSSEGLVTKDQLEVNGSVTLASYIDGSFEKFNLQELLNIDNEILPSSSSYDEGLMNDEDYLKELVDSSNNLSQLESVDKKIEPSSSFTQELGQLTLNGSSIGHGNLVPNGDSRSQEKEKPTKSINTIKKWVRGKLVEVTEEED